MSQGVWSGKIDLLLREALSGKTFMYISSQLCMNLRCLRCMNKVLLTVAIALIFSSCDHETNSFKCFHGYVIMSSCCSGTTFIELDGITPIGKATTLNGQDYKNVIQVPGYLTGGEIYLNLREYNEKGDESTIPQPHCYCLISVGMNVPMWVQTNYSNSACPASAE